MRLPLPVLTFHDESDDLDFVGVYPHRNAIPPDLWDQLFHSAEARPGPSRRLCLSPWACSPDFIRTLDDKASDGVSVRIVLGDPDSESVALRSAEERLGDGVLSARIKYGLVPYSPLIGTPGIEFRFSSATLYNSIFRLDDEMITNNHIYGVPGAHAPALHLRKLGAGDLFGTYAKSFEDVWDRSKPASW